MKLPAAAYSAEVATSATKAGSYGVFGEGESCRHRHRDLTTMPSVNNIAILVESMGPSRMLKKSASSVLTSFRPSTYPSGYASALHSLRPCWTNFLSILRDVLFLSHTCAPKKFWRANMVFPQPARGLSSDRSILLSRSLTRRRVFGIDDLRGIGVQLPKSIDQWLRGRRALVSRLTHRMVPGKGMNAGVRQQRADRR